MTGIQKLDLNDASEKLRDKIKLAFSEVLSEEQWKALIEAELKRFVTETRKTNRYEPDSIIPSELTKICTDVFKDAFSDKLRILLESEDFKTQIQKAAQRWLDENRQDLVSTAIFSMLQFNLSRVLGDFTQQALMQFEERKNDVQRY